MATLRARRATITIQYNSGTRVFRYKVKQRGKTPGYYTPLVGAAKGGGDSVRWECTVDGEPQGQFAVQFVGATPFHKTSYRPTRQTPEFADAKFKRGFVAGQYHYMVAVVVNGDVFTDDPDIITWPT